MAIRKKHHFGTFPDTSPHPQIKLFFRIFNLAYRSNETFCSKMRHPSISRPCLVWRLVDKCTEDDYDSAAHVDPGMVN